MQANKSEKLGTEAVIPLLIRLSVPSIIAMSIQAMYNVVDSFYIGRVSTEALSALSLAYPLQMILIAVAVGTGVGTSSFISRQLGKNNKERANNAAEHVILSAAVYGIIIALIGLFYSDKLIGLFIDNPDIINMGADYIKIIFAGSTALFIPMIGNDILRGEGNTFYPMIIMLIGSILNIILDPFFIFGIGFFPEWGVAGAAVATVLSRIISGCLLLVILFSDKNELSLNLKSFKFDFSIITAVYRVGLPAMIMQLLASIMLSFLNIILGTQSEAAVAVVGLYFRLQSFVFMPVFGLNQGYMPILGYNYGHKNPERMKKTIRAALLVAFTFTTIGFIIFQIFPDGLIRIFSDDPELLNLGASALQKISLAFPIIGLAIIIGSTFQAIGRGWPSLVISFLRQIIILVPLFALFLNLFGLDNVWYAFPISELATFFLGVFWLYKTLKTTFNSMETEAAYMKS